ncbi:MAG: N-acetyltransferase family protein, partial [Sulfuricurvum sp.]
DLKQMAELLGQLFSIEDDFTIDFNKQVLGLQLLFQSSDSMILVAEISNRVVGRISMQSLISTAMGERGGLIEDMIVSHAFRGIGIGRLLLSSIIKNAKSLGYGRITLGADRRNERAINFYSKFGFETSNMGLMYHLPRAP